MKKIILAFLLFPGVFPCAHGNVIARFFSHERALWSSSEATIARSLAAYAMGAAWAWLNPGNRALIKKMRFYALLYFAVPAMVFVPARILAYRAIKNDNRLLLQKLLDSGLVEVSGDEKHPSFLGPSRLLFNYACSQDAQKVLKELIEKRAIAPQSSQASGQAHYASSFEPWIARALESDNIALAHQLYCLRGGREITEAKNILVHQKLSPAATRFLFERTYEKFPERFIQDDCSYVTFLKNQVHNPLVKTGTLQMNTILYELLMPPYFAGAIYPRAYDQERFEQAFGLLLETYVQNQGAIGIERLEWMLSLVLYRAWVCKTALKQERFDAAAFNHFIEWFYNAIKQKNLLFELRHVLERLGRINPGDFFVGVLPHDLRQLATFTDFKFCLMKYVQEPELHSSFLSLGWDYSWDLCVQQSDAVRLSVFEAAAWCDDKKLARWMLLLLKPERADLVTLFTPQSQKNRTWKTFGRAWLELPGAICGQINGDTEEQLTINQLKTERMTEIFLWARRHEKKQFSKAVLDTVRNSLYAICSDQRVEIQQAEDLVPQQFAQKLPQELRQEIVSFV